MNRVSVSITNFGIRWDDRFVASSIPKALQERIGEAKAALEASTPSNYPGSVALAPALLIATQAELDFKRLTELVNEPSDKPVLAVRLPSGVWAWPGGIPHNYYILDGHHRVASAKLRGVLVKAIIIKGA